MKQNIKQTYNSIPDTDIILSIGALGGIDKTVNKKSKYSRQGLGKQLLLSLVKISAVVIGYGSL